MNLYITFTLLIISHLTGDFLLQTAKIADLKQEGRKGILLHTGIVTTAHILFLCMFGFIGIIAGITAGISHFFIDNLKKNIKPYFKKSKLTLFIFDQLLHIISIFFISMLASSVIKPINATIADSKALLVNNRLIIWLLAAYTYLLLCLIYSIFAKLLISDIFRYSVKPLLFKKSERLVDIVFLHGISLVYASFLLKNLITDFSLQVVALLILSFVYLYIQRHIFRYRRKIVILKFGGSFLFSFLMLTFIFYPVMVKVFNEVLPGID